MNATQINRPQHATPAKLGPLRSAPIRAGEPRPAAALQADTVASGAPIGATGEKDSHGNLQLSGSGHLGDFLASAVKSRLGIKRVRADTFGYLQRSFAGCVSTVDAEEAFAAGAFAAKAMLKGREVGGSVVLEREARKRYRSRCRLVEVSKLAKATRPLDERFLAKGPDIARSFVDWAMPLVGELPQVETLELERWSPRPRARG